MFSHSDRYDNSAGWQQVLISTEGGPLVVGHIRRGLSGVNQCRIHSDPSIINYFPPVINFFLSGYSSPDIWQYFGESYVCLTVNSIVGILVISDPNNADPQ